jgi:hypothetical protein
MKIKLKESIRANGIQYRPPVVVDSEEIGITQADVDVLVRRGTAEIAPDEAPATPEASNEVEQVEAPAPEVINLGDEAEKPAAKPRKR